jgi:large subunit ribosomal protein L21
MYAVIKTGGKQYRVQAGDMLVVEKLDGAAGAEVAFNEVLMVGEGADVTVGAPLVEGAVVNATLIETRKGEKVKIFKKIRRQGYRRTRGHRQLESVLQVTAIAGGGKTATWDGEVNLTPRSELLLRARNLAHRTAAELPAGVEVETLVEPEGEGKSPRVRAHVVEGAEATAPEPHEETAAPKKAASKKAAPKEASGKTAGPKKGPNMRDTAKSGAPKQSKAQARAPVRRTSPRGKG